LNVFEIFTHLKQHKQRRYKDKLECTDEREVKIVDKALTKNQKRKLKKKRQKEKRKKEDQGKDYCTEINVSTEFI
jgi:hypothetical protein